MDPNRIFMPEQIEVSHFFAYFDVSIFQSAAFPVFADFGITALQ